MGIETLLNIIKDYAPKDKALIIRAYEYASRVHRGVVRKSGEPYITHPLAVACIAADMHADVETIASCLLHDVIEDGDHITQEMLAEEFYSTIAYLVDGVSKLPKFSIENDKVKTDAYNLRKVVESVTYDVRIWIIKLADRLHNMRTLNFHKPEKQKEIAEETRKIYVPLANFIGAFEIKKELEDLAFKYLEPDEYEKTNELLLRLKRENYDIVEESICRVSQLLNSLSMPFELKLKVKNSYNLFDKLNRFEINDIHDLFSVSIVLSDVDSCYYIKDRIKELYPPVLDREKDYIKNPKTNMYSALHTTVLAPNKQMIQFQLSTKSMYLINTFGITSYWDLLKFDHAPEHMQDDIKKMPFFKALEDLINTGLQNDEFNEAVQKDILDATLYLKTPAGDTIELPAGSTPIDFAYKIHQDIGNWITGAVVNGEKVPIDYELQNNDEVFIIFQENLVGPRQDLINKCRTLRAKRKIDEFNNIYK